MYKHFEFVIPIIALQQFQLTYQFPLVHIVDNFHQNNMLFYTRMNLYLQTSAPQYTFCFPHLHKMKIEISNIVIENKRTSFIKFYLEDYDITMIYTRIISLRGEVKFNHTTFYLSACTKPEK